MKLSRIAAAVALSSAISAPAFAVDGQFSTTQSVGSTVITANIGNLVLISNIDDPITLVPTALGGLSYTDNICLFRNGSNAQNLNITFNSATGVGAFQLTDGTNTVNYSVGVVAGTFNSTVSDGSAQALAAASSNLPDCGGGDNASYTLDITPAAVIGATAGNYTDTLTITVAPI